MAKLRPLSVIPLAFGLVCLAAGCEKNPNAPAKVSGTVKYKDQPLKGGTVQFQTADGSKISGMISPQGTYAITDAPAGEMVVTVETESVKPPAKPVAYGGGGRREGGQQPPPGRDSGPTMSYVEIPKKYADPKQSPLKTTINRGNNKYDIDLTD
jgi:hypothetical protein